MDEEADADALVRMTQTTTVTFLGETVSEQLQPIVKFGRSFVWY